MNQLTIEEWLSKGCVRLVLEKAPYKLLCRRVRSRDKRKCRCCGTRNSLQIHHVVYRSHGGPDAEWNLLTLCGVCHDATHEGHAVPRQPSTVVNANEAITWELRDKWVPGRPFYRG